MFRVDTQITGCSFQDGEMRRPTARLKCLRCHAYSFKRPDERRNLVLHLVGGTLDIVWMRAHEDVHEGRKETQCICNQRVDPGPRRRQQREAVGTRDGGVNIRRLTAGARPTHMCRRVPAAALVRHCRQATGQHMDIVEDVVPPTKKSSLWRGESDGVGH